MNVLVIAQYIWCNDIMFSRPIIPPPIIMLSCMGLAYLLGLYFPLVTFDLSFTYPIVAVLVVVGACFNLHSVFNFHKQDTTINPISPDKANTLVVDGLFKVSRNPMYFGMAVLVTAVAVYCSALSSFFAILVFVLLLNAMQINPEERALEAKFGESYRQYKRQVRRWI